MFLLGVNLKTIELGKEIDHGLKRGQTCASLEPNFFEDTIFTKDGFPCGFYIKKMDEKLCKIADLANSELLSERVPKSNMTRVMPMGVDSEGNKVYQGVQQFSTIIGSCAKKPHLRRHYHTKSSVHLKKSALNFIKAMSLLVKGSEALIKMHLPELYGQQKKEMARVEEKWRFGELFTSSISNCNIAADFHIDNANIKNTVNVIITKRNNAEGGCLHVPDYNLTFEQPDNSILVYPAWRNLHGVTPIKNTKSNGYRNTLIFYPLKAFVEKNG